MSEVDLVLRAAGSHLYPGATGTVRGRIPAAETPCLLEFADGAATLATLAAAECGHVVATEPYITARGAAIPAKRWVVALAGGPGEQRFRVLRRAAPG